jgi:hypothetical protein
MRRPTITIVETSGTYSATIDMDPIRCDLRERIKWKIRPPQFPYTVFVQEFRVDIESDITRKIPVEGCLVEAVRGRQKSIRHSASDHRIDDGVGFREGSFPYYIGYIDDDGNDHELIDPEIIVEGNKRQAKKAKKAKKVKKAKKNKATKARSASRAKPAKKAKKAVKKVKKATKAARKAPRRKAKKAKKR